jgi:hypothetical protein
MRLSAVEGSREGVTHLAQQSQDFETPVVDLQLRRAGEAREAIGKSIHKVEEVLRHCDSFWRCVVLRDEAPALRALVGKLGLKSSQLRVV